MKRYGSHAAFMKSREAPQLKTSLSKKALDVAAFYKKLFSRIVPSISRRFAPPSFKRVLSGSGLRPHFEIVAKRHLHCSLLIANC